MIWLWISMLFFQYSHPSLPQSTLRKTWVCMLETVQGDPDILTNARILIRVPTFQYPTAFNKVAPVPENLEKLHGALATLESYLSKSSYAVGDNITIADHSLAASAETIRATGDCLNQLYQVVFSDVNLFTFLPSSKYFLEESLICRFWSLIFFPIGIKSHAMLLYFSRYNFQVPMGNNKIVVKI